MKLGKPDVTDNALQQLLKNKEYCYDELCRIRKMWGNREKFTHEAIEASRRVLTGMLLYGPEEIYSIVYCHLDELGRREILCFFK